MKLKNRWYQKDGKAGLKNPKADKTFRRQMARLKARMRKEEEEKREQQLNKKNKKTKDNN